MSRRVSGYENLQRELRDEKAAALARIGSVLQETIDRLAVACRELAEAAPEDRERLTASYRALRAKAARYRWYLEVQREVVGFRTHELIDELYRIPDPL